MRSSRFAVSLPSNAANEHAAFITAMSPRCPETRNLSHTSDIASRYPSGTRVNLTRERALDILAETSASWSANSAMKANGSSSYLMRLDTISSRVTSSSELERNTQMSNLSRTWFGMDPSSASIVATTRNEHSLIPDTPSLSTMLIPVSAAFRTWNAIDIGTRLMFSTSRTFPSALEIRLSDILRRPSRSEASRSMPPKTWSSEALSGRFTTLLPPATVAMERARTDLPVPLGPHISTDDMSGDDRAHSIAPLARSFPTNAENGYSGLTPPQRSS